MVNKTDKGRRIELEARKMLEEDGYLTDFKPNVRWQSSDLFNMFDIIAIGKETKLIQIKSNATDFYKARREIGLWVDKNDIKDISFEIWLREPRKAWRCEKIKPQNQI